MKNAIIFGGVSRALQVADTRPAHAASAAHTTAFAAHTAAPAAAATASVDGGTS
jgi:hypothetical protein